MGPLSEESGEPPAGEREGVPRRAASMGPLSEESGEHELGHLPDRLRHAASMGPLSEESGELRDLRPREHARRLLQWGRSPKRAERLDRASGEDTRRIASMGPLSEESGEFSKVTQLAEECFQASMGPLSEESGGDGNSRSGGSRLHHASMGPLSEESGERRPCGGRRTRTRACFNGAALRRERRAAKRPKAPVFLHHASMGPLSEESGEAGGGPKKKFGGSTHLHHASMGPLSEESGEVVVAGAAEPFVAPLQWGRSPKRAESSPVADMSSDEFHASMGPLSEESGERIRVHCRARRWSNRFNGAALRRERRVAAFGPIVQAAPQLQWGRSPKRAESLFAGHN